MVSKNLPQTSEEQILYANLLEKGMRLGLVLLIVTFAIYMLGIIEPAIPLKEISGYWNISVHDYLEAINHEFLHLSNPPTGWSWIRLLGKSDFLNFIPIAILSGVTVLCYLAIIPGLLRKKDKVYAIISLAEVMILGLAASGLLTAGH
ncbi:hypothetical protein KKH56_05955 [bacterium]|nr:hypothetical protein [bacterium]